MSSLYSSSTSTALFNLEIECHVLALFLRDPSVWGDFYMITRDDWSAANQPVYDIIALQLNANPPGSVEPLILTERLKSMGILQLVGGLEPWDYLQGLKNRFIEKGESANLAKELKRLSVRRELITRLDETKKKLVQNGAMGFEEMTKLTEQGLSSVTTSYHKPEVTEVFGNLIEVVEQRAAKPLKAEELGFLGPFRSINETIGPLSYHSSLVVVGARSGLGKSSFGWFNQTYLLEKYPNTHLLHLDAAEMTFDELCWRAVCCMSGGKIPYEAVFRGRWEQNREWRDLIRGEIWPRAEKMKNRMGFKNVGNMSPSERVNFIRRYYYNKVGRGNHLLIHEDYLKSAESSKNVAEYQAIGRYVGDLKSLITDDIIASVHTSVQNNRVGTVTGKKEADINDSEEAFSLSDRILQQSTHSFILRHKVTEELAREMNNFGNMALKLLKKRQLLGEKYKDLLVPVRTANGRYVPNYFNINSHDFFYEDRGTYKEMVERLGLNVVSTANGAPIASPI